MRASASDIVWNIWETKLESRVTVTFLFLRVFTERRINSIPCSFSIQIFWKIDNHKQKKYIPWRPCSRETEDRPVSVKKYVQPPEIGRYFSQCIGLIWKIPQKNPPTLRIPNERQTPHPTEHSVRLSFSSIFVRT